MEDFSPEFFESLKEGIQHSKINLLNCLCIKPEIAELRHVRYSLPLTSMHRNHVGMMYAGSLFCFAEGTGSHLLRSTYGSKYTPILKSISVDYLKPAKTDIYVDISMTEEEAKERIAYVEEHGKGRYPMSIAVMTADGEQCASLDIVYYLIKN